MKRVRLLLADDHTIVLNGLRVLLDSESDFEVVGEAGTGIQAVALALSLCPDVVVMDLQMPKLNGLEAAKQIIASVPTAKVLALSAHIDDALVEALAAVGVQGFVLKQATTSVLSHAIREVFAGKFYFCPVLLKGIKRKQNNLICRTDKFTRDKFRLTSRELEVLERIAEGYSNKQIAAQLNISVKTIEKHRQQVMEKIGIHETAGLTRYAVNAGLIQCGIQLSRGPASTSDASLVPVIGSGNGPT